MYFSPRYTSCINVIFSGQKDVLDVPGSNQKNVNTYQETQLDEMVIPGEYLLNFAKSVCLFFVDSKVRSIVYYYWRG